MRPEVSFPVAVEYLGQVGESLTTSTEALGSMTGWQALNLLPHDLILLQGHGSNGNVLVGGSKPSGTVPQRGNTPEWAPPGAIFASEAARIYFSTSTGSADLYLQVWRVTDRPR